jgi:magnesium chelatase family protein
LRKNPVIGSFEQTPIGLRLLRHRGRAGRGAGADLRRPPAFLLVGLPDKAVGEARERVRAASPPWACRCRRAGADQPEAPADLLKEGSHFDLPIALGRAGGDGRAAARGDAGYAALGELSLDGTLNPVAGVLPAAIGAARDDLGLICPAARAARRPGPAHRGPGGARPAGLINHFRGTQVLTPPDHRPAWRRFGRRPTWPT